MVSHSPACPVDSEIEINVIAGKRRLSATSRPTLLVQTTRAKPAKRRRLGAASAIGSDTMRSEAEVSLAPARLSIPTSRRPIHATTRRASLCAVRPCRRAMTTRVRCTPGRPLYRRRYPNCRPHSLRQCIALEALVARLAPTDCASPLPGNYLLAF